MLGYLVAASFVATGASCSSDATSADRPSTEKIGIRAHIYRSLAELVGDACAIVVASPVGAPFSRPMRGGGADTPYQHMRIDKVISGAVSSTTVDVVSPGLDVTTQKPALLAARSFVLFLAPAMYAKNDPAGGYAIVGGPAGVYSVTPKDDATFLRIDDLSPDLPSKIDIEVDRLPPVAKTADQLLREGPH